MSKLRSGTSKTMQFVPVHLDLPLFWKSHCTTCSPACVILYRVTGSCKGPIILSGKSMICESYLTLDCLEVQTSPAMFKLEMCVTFYFSELYLFTYLIHSSYIHNLHYIDSEYKRRNTGGEKNNFNWITEMSKSKKEYETENKLRDINWKALRNYLQSTFNAILLTSSDN